MDGGGGGGEGELPRPLRLRSRQKEATVGRKERNTPRSLARRTGANRAAMWAADASCQGRGMFRNILEKKKQTKKRRDLWFWYTGFFPPPTFFHLRFSKRSRRRRKSQQVTNFPRKFFQNASIGRHDVKVLYRTYFRIFVIFLLRYRHEMPRTINHPKTLKMFDRKISERVLKAVLY